MHRTTKPRTKAKPARIIYRPVAGIDQNVFRRYVAQTDDAQLVVELPETMPAAEAQYLACQALADAYIYRKLCETAISELRRFQDENVELEDGIEHLLAQLETYWNQASKQNFH